jgi:regulator of replication initiation timing
MGLIEAIEKLLTEHTSAEVQRQRVELVKEQCAALEKKLAELQSENQALKKEKQGLVAETQRLGLELSAQKASSASLSPEKQRALIAVARLGRPNTNRVATALNLNPILVEQCLTELERGHFLYGHIYFGRPQEYTLAEAGRKYLIENKLLGAVGNPIGSAEDDTP